MSAVKASIKYIDGVYCGHPKLNWEIDSKRIPCDLPATATIVTTACGLCGRSVAKPYYITSFIGGKTITTPMPAHAAHAYLEREKHVAANTIRQANNSSAYRAKQRG